MAAAETIGRIGFHDKAAAEALLVALKDPAENLRSDAATALGGVGPVTKEVVPALIEAAKDDKDVTLRTAAVEALGAIGPEAKDAVPLLIDALKKGKGRSPYRDDDAIKSLAAIGEPAAGPLFALLKDSDPSRSRPGATCLG